MEPRPPQQPTQQFDLITKPDPTVLTTEQLLREIDRVVKLLEARITGVDATLEAKISGLGERMEAEMVGMNERLDARFTGYLVTQDTRFAGVQHEFELVESRRIEQKIDTKTAVDAAFLAAKDAVREQTASSDRSIAKSEASTKEQATQQYATITAELKAIRDNVADVKNRVIVIESTKQGQTEVKANQAGTIASVATAMFLIIALLGIFATLVTRLP